MTQIIPSNIRNIDIGFFEDFIMPNYLVGERFGQLIVRQYLKRGNARNPNSAVWECECDCGGHVIASSSELRRGLIQCCSACERPRKRTTLYRVLALDSEGLSTRQIQKKTGVPKSTVQRWLSDAKNAA